MIYMNKPTMILKRRKERKKEKKKKKKKKKESTLKYNDTFSCKETFIIL